jgi:hypothetical protein
MAHVIHKEIFEILEEFSKETTRPKRKAVLEKYADVPAFRDVLRGTFDESLEWVLPVGKPPFVANKPESIPSTLLREHRQFGYFVKGAKSSGLPAYKRENMFIRLLEAIHPQDAEVVLSMVSKKSPVKYLTKKLVQEAFPKLITT